MDATIHHTGLTDEERARLTEFKEVFAAAAKYPEDSAMRAMLDKRLAILEVQLGI